MAALPAAQAQEAVRQDAAFEEGAELVTVDLRWPGTGSDIGRCEETVDMLLHQALQRGLLGAVARVVDRGTIAMCPLGLVSVGLHALGMENLGRCSFSGRAGQRIRLWGIIDAQRHGAGPAAAQHLARERRRWPCSSGHSQWHPRHDQSSCKHCGAQASGEPKFSSERGKKYD